MALRDLAGTGALQDALETTNARLSEVLSELKKTNGEALGSMNDHLVAVLRQLEETNSQRLEAVAVELRSLNGKLDRLVTALEKD